MTTLMVVLLVAATAARAEDWPGWRGGGRDGANATSSAPLRWGPTENVTWKTAIPGRGHSSPIVFGDHVYVTTAYPSAREQSVFDSVSYFKVACAVIVLALAVAQISKLCRAGEWTTRQVWTVVAFGAVAAGTAALAVFGEGTLDFDRCSIRAWLGSSLTASLCLALAALPMHRRSVLRRAAGVGCVILSIVVPLAMPAREHAFRSGYASPSAAVVVAFSLAPLFVGVLILTLETRWAVGGAAVRVSRGRAAVRLLLVTGAAGAALGAGVWLMRLGARRWEYLSYHLGDIHVRSAVAAWFVWALLGAAAVALITGLVVPASDDARPGRRRRAWLAAMALLLAVVQFGQANYLPRTGGVRRAVVCLDRGDGRVLWTCEALTAPVGMLHRDNSPATPTPVADERGVYAVFGGAGAMGVSHRGELLWTAPGLRFDTVFGYASSPVLCGGALVVVADEPHEPYVTALDVATGRRLWTRERTAYPTWAGGASRTPHFKTLNGRAQLLIWGRGGLAGYDARSGEALWSFPLESGGDAVAGAVFDEARVYVWKEPGTVEALNLETLAGAAASGRYDDAVVWRRRLPACPNCASPVLAGGMLFVVSDLGVASCLDAATGAVRAKRRVEGPCMASLGAAGGRVYIPSNPGTVTVLSADAEFQILAQNELDGRLYASPAIVDGQMILRTESHVYCIDDRAQRLPFSPSAKAP